LHKLDWGESVHRIPANIHVRTSFQGDSWLDEQEAPICRFTMAVFQRGSANAWRGSEP
jgi:hypothetical protein